MNICLILFSNIKDEKNRAIYQRIFYLAKINNLHIFTRKRVSIPDEILKYVHFYPAPVDPFFLKGKLYFVFDYFIFVFWVFLKIIKRKKKYKFQIIYTFQHPHSIVGVLFKLFKLKWVVDILDLPSLDLEYARERKMFIASLFLLYLLLLMKNLLRKADLIISAILQEGLSEYQLNPKNILSISNGVDLNITRPQKKKKKSYKFTILYVGSIRPSRGIDTLIKSMAYIKNTIPHVKLLLIGHLHNYFREHFSKLIKKLDVEESTEFLGVIKHDEVLNLINSSDICVYPFPNKKELNIIYPIKVFEYLAMNKVVIASNLKGVSRIIKDGYNGILVNPGDSKEIARAVIKIYQNKKLREKLEKNARISIQEYHWDNINCIINDRLKKNFNLNSRKKT